ncbi:CYTH domain-containing protein [Intestinirhabdus alba]|jgi:triphosphatase|uniref:CYTH domain-containing protein n=1 Tax=Intestinirhabdus alba TaxID=2899544 RepID=A0A6L6IL21_9ENTR|nr:inorganic triphosphatase [Intestinirhabdus alba]MTH46634.1 CYTH domain-containing protein [Intestinirhabdus alba]
MAQEIELKFIVSHDAIEALRDYLQTLGGEHHAPVQLRNIYYETADGWLRAHDMGLRIRGEDGRYEMTMKTAGRTIGGLHQRPEYNVPLSGPALELDRFPAEVWPGGELPADLAGRTQPLFSTDFCREKWQLDMDDSRIEIALDLGEIAAGALAEPLCELELELLSGETRAVLALANQLVSQAGLRLGSLSKAARGYHLAQGNAPRSIVPTTVLKMPPKASVEQGLEAALALGLAQWQRHEELWVRGDEAAKAAVLEATGLIRHALGLFGGIIPRKASAYLRECLTLAEAEIASGTSAVTAVYSPHTVRAQLALTEWLATCGWRPFLDAKGQDKIAHSFKRFADIHLSRTAAGLKSDFGRPLGDKYRDRLPRLSRDIDCLLLLAGYYESPVVEAWLENWRGLRHAIVTGQPIEIEHFRNEAICLQPFWLHSGKR